MVSLSSIEPNALSAEHSVYVHVGPPHQSRLNLPSGRIGCCRLLAAYGYRRGVFISYKFAPFLVGSVLCIVVTFGVRCCLLWSSIQVWKVSIKKLRLHAKFLLWPPRYGFELDLALECSLSRISWVGYLLCVGCQVHETVGCWWMRWELKALSSSGEFFLRMLHIL